MILEKYVIDKFKEHQGKDLGTQVVYLQHMVIFLAHKIDNMDEALKNKRS